MQTAPSGTQRKHIWRSTAKWAQGSYMSLWAMNFTSQCAKNTLSWREWGEETDRSRYVIILTAAGSWTVPSVRSAPLICTICRWSHFHVQTRYQKQKSRACAYLHVSINVSTNRTKCTEADCTSVKSFCLLELLFNTQTQTQLQGLFVLSIMSLVVHMYDKPTSGGESQFNYFKNGVFI